MQEKLLQFQNYLVRNSKSIGTAKIYTYHVKQMLIACPELNQDTLDNYLTNHASKAEGTYMNLTINALRAYFKYAELDLLLPKWAKVTHKKIVSLPMDFIEKKLLPSIEHMNYHNPYKAKALLYLMAYTGMRKCEMPLLKRENIDLENGELKAYLKKTHKEHIFLFPKKVAKEIKQYFTTEPEKENAFNITERSVDCIFRKLKEYFKGEVNLFPHLLKKVAITHLHNICGFSLKEISEMVGISVQTIEGHYLDCDIEKIKETYNRRIK